jgi:hypothetical protein
VTICMEKALKFIEMLTQLNHQIIYSVFCAFSYRVSCETNTSKIIYFIRTHNFGSFDQTHSLIICPSVKGFESDVVKCDNV